MNPKRIDLIVGGHERVRLIRNFIVHPEFVMNTFDNDIARIHMDKPVIFTNFIRPVCLPTNGKNREEMKQSYKAEDFFLFGYV